MFHRIRAAMADGAPAMFSGTVEADETFVGGKRRSTMTTSLGFKKMKHGPFEGKVTVFGMAQRGTEGKKSRARAFVVPNHKAVSLLPKIYENVLPGSILYTDALRSYRQAAPDYIHEFIDHSLRYVEGRV
jgi:hypothetical protein